MNTIALRRIFPLKRTSTKFNVINSELMPDVENYWLSKGRYDHKRYEDFLAVRNTEILRTDEGDFEIAYDYKNQSFKVRKGYISADNSVRNLSEPISMSLETAEEIVKIMNTIKNRQK
jgi:hypothetical protein